MSNKIWRIGQGRTRVSSNLQAAVRWQKLKPSLKVRCDATLDVLSRSGALLSLEWDGETPQLVVGSSCRFTGLSGTNAEDCKAGPLDGSTDLTTALQESMGSAYNAVMIGGRRVYLRRDSIHRVRAELRSSQVSVDSFSLVGGIELSVSVRFSPGPRPGEGERYCPERGVEVAVGHTDWVALLAQSLDVRIRYQDGRVRGRVQSRYHPVGGTIRATTVRGARVLDAITLLDEKKSASSWTIRLNSEPSTKRCEASPSTWVYRATSLPAARFPETSPLAVLLGQ